MTSDKLLSSIGVLSIPERKDISNEEESEIDNIHNDITLDSYKISLYEQKKRNKMFSAEYIINQDFPNRKHGTLDKM